MCTTDASRCGLQMLLVEEAPQAGPSSQQQQQLQQQGVELLPGVVADATDLAVLERMSEEERAAVMKRLRKMQAEQERQQKVSWICPPPACVVSSKVCHV